jgi:APA family basic amino acid/polyamine antiporter
LTDDRTRNPGTLGAFDLGCVAVGGIVGVGIFFTPAEVARRVDSVEQAMCAWLLGGIGVVLGALVFAELAVRLPGHGGTYRYMRESFGRLPAFLFGWSNGFLIQAGASGIIGLVFADNLDILLHGRSGASAPEARIGAAVLAILLFTAVNALGLKAGKRVQNTLTVTKVLAVLSIVGLAVWVHGQVTQTAPVVTAAPGDLRGWPAALMAALLPVLFASGGWQQASFLAGAARRPRRDVPLGITVGVFVVVLIYLAVNLAYFDLLGLEGARASDAIAADAARAGLTPFGLGESAAKALALMVCLSSLGILNTICMAPPYVLMTMAEDGVFFRPAGRVSTRSGAPVTGVLMQSCWAAALLLIVATAFDGDPADTLSFLLDGVVFVDWIFFGLCGLAVLRLHKRAPDAGLSCPGVRLVAGGFCVMGTVVAVCSISISPNASLAGLLGVGFGAVLYALLWRTRRSSIAL